ncbi:MAG: hypothetical protein GWP06_06350 [Actinobacteria bacterium]|nr:hypothetical protein [Actinomycetota bacterium]
MNSYQIDIIFSILRITFLAVLFFVLLPRFYRLQNQTQTRHHELFAGIILSVTFVVLLGYILEFLHLYDTLIILLVIIFSLGMGIIFHFGGLDKFVVLFNTFFLRELERDRRIEIKAFCLKLIRKTNRSHLLPKILFLAVFIIAAVIRLWPVFQHASPFAIETFQTIESVKKLELNHSAFTSGMFPMGMQFLIDFIYQLTRTDVGIITHLFGIISTLLLMSAIYFIVNSITGNGYAGILGASIFGIFTHLLPISINQQIEAESISLATAIAIPTIFYGLRAFILKQKYLIIIFVSGVLTVLLTSRFVAVMLLFAVITFFLVTLFWRRKLGNYLHINFFVHILLFIVPLAAMVSFQFFLARDYVFLEKARFFFYNEHFIRYSIDHFQYNEFLFALITFLSGIFVLTLAVFDKNILTAIAKSFTGLYTFFLLVLWQNYWLALRNILDWRQVGLFIAVFECINIGIIFYFILTQLLPGLTKKFGSIKLKTEFLRFAFTFIVIVVLWGISKPGIASFNNRLEPDGFTMAVYKIKKKFFPYQWTAVSHFGTRALVLNSGRFMDYGFFLQNFSPESVHNNNSRFITTQDVFIFAVKDSLNSKIDTGLLPNVPDFMKKILRWCRTYSQLYSDMTIFYEDKQVVVFHICRNLSLKTNGKDNKSKPGSYL